MHSNKFSIRNRIKSFSFAFNGLKILFREEHNARIHMLTVVITTFAGFYLKISLNEWIVVLFAFGLVISMEIVNSSIENIADFISPEKHHLIEKIKDLAAAGVLVCSITAMAIGLIIFLPKLISLLA